MADNTVAIAAIDTILQGAERITVDGQTVTHNFAELRRERRRLENEDDTNRSRRPVASRIKLNGIY